MNRLFWNGFFCLSHTLLLLLVAGGLSAPSAASAQRVTQSLNGTWEVAESARADAMPEAYDHTVPVPGLMQLAEPAFEDVGAFYGREFLQNVGREFFRGKLTDEQLAQIQRLDTTGLAQRAGISVQSGRSYFWYRRAFDAPPKRARAVLGIGKAKYGVAVWCNGQRVATTEGEEQHLGPFTPSYFDLTEAVNWGGENDLVVRVGAHPGVLPPGVMAGTDKEKLKWYPGLYDDVEVRFTSGLVAIEHVQVAPRVDSSLALVQTTVKNYGDAEAAFSLAQRARTWEGGEAAGEASRLDATLPAGADTTLTQRVAIRDARLWTPEDPFLYVVETSAETAEGGSDAQESRFGMRDFRFRPATKRAYLNGAPYFLRGSNVTLHRFFEDPEMGTKPWDEDWVRTFLGEVADRMHWNAFRFCIGPVPELWLDIADEEGLLIQNEMQVWSYRDDWDTEIVIGQYEDWVRANWNHPSVAIWDASNETHAEVYADEIIPAVRPLDLSNRPWDNGYNLPAGPTDPVEDHPYGLTAGGVMWGEFTGDAGGYPGFTGGTGAKSTNSPHPTGHAAIINEYAYIWLHRDGTPTVLTGEMWDYLAGPDATPEERLELQNYLLAGETEYWRAHRTFAGILHFVALSADFPGALTADHFADLDRLTLHDAFADYVGNAFKPLGVFINRELWTPAGQEGGPAAPPMEAGMHEVAVMLVNDHAEAREGTLALTLEGEGGGEMLAQTERSFHLPARGQMTYVLALEVPVGTSRATLKATATPESDEAPTVSRRWVRLRGAAARSSSQ